MWYVNLKLVGNERGIGARVVVLYKGSCRVLYELGSGSAKLLVGTASRKRGREDCESEREGEKKAEREKDV